MLRVFTERLYYCDAYAVEFEGQGTEVCGEGRRVYLDRTAFYPASGGQPCDCGTLGGIDVVEVLEEEDGRIAHVLAGSIAVGATVAGKIDWPLRYEHMQQHTGQHLLSAVLVELYGFPTLSFHMGEEVRLLN